jgi:hypothetical protein
MLSVLYGQRRGAVRKAAIGRGLPVLRLHDTNLASVETCLIQGLDGINRIILSVKPNESEPPVQAGLAYTGHVNISNGTAMVKQLLQVAFVGSIGQVFDFYRGISVIIGVRGARRRGVAASDASRQALPQPLVGQMHSHDSSIHDFTVHGVSCFYGIALALVLDETEAPALVGHGILHNVDVTDSSILWRKFSEVYSHP